MIAPRSEAPCWLRPRARAPCGDGEVLPALRSQGAALRCSLLLRLRARALRGAARALCTLLLQDAFGVIASPGGNAVFAAGGALCLTPALESVAVWNVKQAVLVSLLRAEHNSAQVTALAASPDERHVAAGYEDGQVRVWALQSASCLLVLSGHRCGGLRAGAAPAPAALIAVLRGRRGAVTALRYNRDGSLLASGSRDTDVIVWDPVAGERPGPARAPARPRPLAHRLLRRDGLVSAARAQGRGDRREVPRAEPSAHQQLQGHLLEALGHRHAALRADHVRRASALRFRRSHAGPGARPAQRGPPARGVELRRERGGDAPGHGLRRPAAAPLRAHARRRRGRGSCGGTRGTRAGPRSCVCVCV